MKTFGQLVRELREKRGWLVQDLAAKCQVSGAYISQIENPHSGTVASIETGQRIINELELDIATTTKLLKALERTAREHKVERVYPSSLLLENFFDLSGLSVAAVAGRLVGANGQSRSRQIVQVWKNGLQLPTPEAAHDLVHVFEEAGISGNDLKEYSKAHLRDTVYFSKDIAHLTDDERTALAACAVSIVEGRHDLPAVVVHTEAARATAGKRRFKPELLDSSPTNATDGISPKPKRRYKFSMLDSEDDESKSS
jgi:transcriptional regulator with XRE-family HTH domain